MTIAQSEESCVVYGMPKAAIEHGFAVRVVALDALANTIMAQCAQERRNSDTGEGKKATGAGRN
jgi:chemotaxis response regulator CheB